MSKSLFYIMSERYKIMFNYGSVGGLLAFVWMMAIYFVGYSPYGLAMFSGIWIPALITFLSVRANSKTLLAQNGYPFARAFFDGVSTAFLTGLLKGMLAFTFFKLIATDFADQYYAEQERLIAFLESANVSASTQIDELKKALELDKKNGFGAYRIVVGEINKYFYTAVPFSIIAALIFKKPIRPNEQE